MYDSRSNPNNFDPTLKNCLFGAVKLTKNSDIDKYKYDAREIFSYPSGGTGENAVVFAANMCLKFCYFLAFVCLKASWLCNNV